MRPPKRYGEPGKLREPVYDDIAMRRMRRAAYTPDYWRVVYEELVHLNEQRVACGYDAVDLSGFNGDGNAR